MASTRTKRNRRDEGGSTPKEGHSKKKGAEKKHFRVPKAGLEALGGEWASLDPFEGNENELYEWISDPALWARVVLGDIDRPASRPPSRASMGGNGDGGNGIGDDTSAAHGRSNGHGDRRSSSSRSQQRLGQLHAGFREALDADGFVLWRSFPPLGPSHLTLRQAGLPLSRLELCRFSIAAQKLTPSSRFGSGWEVRSFPAAAVDSPPWADAARQVIARATFPFMGSTLQLVDQARVRCAASSDTAFCTSFRAFANFTARAFLSTPRFADFVCRSRSATSWSGMPTLNSSLSPPPSHASPCGSTASAGPSRRVRSVSSGAGSCR